MLKKKLENYFEGILQLRTDNDKILDFVKKELESAPEEIFVSKVLELKAGLDIYLSSNKFLMQLGKKLLLNFGGELKVSRKLHTRHKQTGKLLYRLSVLFRPLKFSKGDIIAVGEKVMVVNSIGKTVTGTELLTNKKTKLSLKGADVEVLKPIETTVSKTYPAPEVIHPDTYQSVAVMNPKKLGQSQKVRVVVHKDRIYLA